MTIPLEPVLVWIMVFLRTGFLLAFFPLFGDGFVPLRIRVVLAAVLALVLAPVVPVAASAFPSSTPAMIAMAGSEALLGMCVGFVGRGLFAVVQFAGQIGGEQMGFGIVNSIDPGGMHQIAVVAEMQYLLSILVFLTAGLHHIFIAGLAASFDVLEPGQAVLTAGAANFFVDFGRTIFALTLQFAMPVILVVFIVNLAMAMIGRAVPQINVFLESFPLKIIAGTFVLIATLGLMVQLWLTMFGSMESRLADLFLFMRP
jgi:flagellar biosynthetic protein FliR